MENHSEGKKGAAGGHDSGGSTLSISTISRVFYSNQERNHQKDRRKREKCSWAKLRTGGYNGGETLPPAGKVGRVDGEECKRDMY